MNKRRYLWTGIALLGAFLLWTALLLLVDRGQIGPRGSAVGLSTLNGAFHSLTGVNFALYEITDWLGLVPIAMMLFFALLGLGQLVGRRSLLRVDKDLLIMGGYYVVIFLVYAVFEFVVVNRRPVLIDGFLEASYPSSTTMLVLTVIPSVVMQIQARIKNTAPRRSFSAFLIGFALFMVIGRTLSGVHWLSDIVGGVLLSAGLICLYTYFEKRA